MPARILSLRLTVIFVGYFVLLSFYLIMVAALVTIRLKPLWESGGGRGVLVGIAFLAVPSVLISNELVLPEHAYLVYFVCMALADITMIYIFHIVATKRCKAFDDVRPDPLSTLEDWANLVRSPYSKLNGGSDADDLSALEKRKLESKRKHNLRLDYARAVVALSSRGTYVGAAARKGPVPRSTMNRSSAQLLSRDVLDIVPQASALPPAMRKNGKAL